MERKDNMCKENIIVTGYENVNKAIKAIGQELIKKADEISNDIDKVNSITIKAVLTPAEIVNFDITKNYTATLEENIAEIITPKQQLENMLNKQYERVFGIGGK